MSLTQQAHAELCTISATGKTVRTAEVATLLRFAGRMHHAAGRLVIEAELSQQTVVRRLRDALYALYGRRPVIRMRPRGGVDGSADYLVQIIEGADDVARISGLLDHRGHVVRGLPPRVVAGSSPVLAAAWRGAFLATGTLDEPGRYNSLQVLCPGPEVGSALVGAARRLGIEAKARELRGHHVVAVKDSGSIGTLLTTIGAVQTCAAWEEKQARRSFKAPPNRNPTLAETNHRRSVDAAAETVAKAARALDILGESIPANLAYAGRLRIHHPIASLEELGQLAQPPLTKDAIAGRIRRLLSMAARMEHVQHPPTPPDTR